MKTIKIIITVLLFSISANINAQLLKKLGKAAERAAERTLEKKVEEKASRETDKAFDTVFNNNKGKRKSKKRKKNNRNRGGISLPNDSKNTESQSDVSESLDIYSKFDFVSGNKILLYDDFSLDNIGDFPSKWNTNGAGELVTIKQIKWIKLVGKSLYIPDVLKKLPKNYTVEFDMITKGLDQKTSSQAKLEIWFEDNNQFNHSQNKAIIEIPLCQFINIGFIVENKVNGKRVIRNTIEKDVRAVVLEKVHVSITVNGKRFRMWMNENKVVDIPRLIPENIVSFKLHPRDIRDGIDNIYITNVKIAEAGIDFRSQLLNEGRFSTTGILFNSSSDQIKPESYGVLKQVANALQQDSSLNLNIIGHTDADGNDGQNLTLSQKRSVSVKNALVSQFNIDKKRLQTDGKGETQPVDKNNTTEGKANNRRVEFVKI